MEWNIPSKQCTKLVFRIGFLDFRTHSERLIHRLGECKQGSYINLASPRLPVERVLPSKQLWARVFWCVHVDIYIYIYIWQRLR